MRKIPKMPDGCKLVRFWPPKEPFYLVGHPGVVNDPLPLIEETLARLDRKLAGGNEVFSVEGLISRLHALGVIVEVSGQQRKKKRGKKSRGQILRS